MGVSKTFLVLGIFFFVAPVQSMLGNRKTDTVLDWDMLFLCARGYLRKSNPCDAYASAAYAPLTNFPPVMVHAGALEILRDQTRYRRPQKLHLLPLGF